MEGKTDSNLQEYSIPHIRVPQFPAKNVSCHVVRVDNYHQKIIITVTKLNIGIPLKIFFHVIQKEPSTYLIARCVLNNNYVGESGTTIRPWMKHHRNAFASNVTKAGSSVAYEPGKVIAEWGHKNVYTVTSAEQGRMHTVLSCVSASGYVLSPMILYPRKMFA